MPKPKTATGEKNLISKRLIELREKNHMSQRMLAHQLQLRGYDMDKNVITRIETNKRFDILVMLYYYFLAYPPDMVDSQSQNQISSHLPSFMLLYVSDLSLRQS